MLGKRQHMENTEHCKGKAEKIAWREVVWDQTHVLSFESRNREVLCRGSRRGIFSERLRNVIFLETNSAAMGHRKAEHVEKWRKSFSSVAPFHILMMWETAWPLSLSTPDGVDNHHHLCRPLGPPWPQEFGNFRLALHHQVLSNSGNYRFLQSLCSRCHLSRSVTWTRL